MKITSLQPTVGELYWRVYFLNWDSTEIWIGTLIHEILSSVCRSLSCIKLYMFYSVLGMYILRKQFSIVLPMSYITLKTSYSRYHINPNSFHLLILNAWYMYTLFGINTHAACLLHLRIIKNRSQIMLLLSMLQICLIVCTQCYLIIVAYVGISMG